MLRLKNIPSPPAFHNIFAWRPQSDAMAQFADGARDSRLDLARCLGALAVIYLHCADRCTWNGPAFTRSWRPSSTPTPCSACRCFS